jgi:PAS domain-containing protein
MADDTPEPTGEMADLLRQLRARVDAAAAEIDTLTTEVVSRTRTVDELEALVDALLDVAGTAVVVVGGDRRVKAVSRRAAKALDDADSVGRPISTVLPEHVSRSVAACLDGGEAGGPEPQGAMIQRLSSGDALVILDEQ